MNTSGLLICLMTMICMTVGSVLGTNMAIMTNSSGEDRRQRTVTVREYGLNKNGERVVKLWAVKSRYLPFVKHDVVYIEYPSAEAYEIVKAYGDTEFVAEYIQKRRLFTVTDTYISLKEANSLYALRT